MSDTRPTVSQNRKWLNDAEITVYHQVPHIAGQFNAIFPECLVSGENAR